MINTSSEYKAAVVKPKTDWQLSAKIDYSDYNSDNSIETIVYKEDRLSDAQQIADGIESPTYKWWSWNNFEWGQHLRSPNHTDNEKGALSERIADQSGNFPVRSSIVAASGNSAPVAYQSVGCDFQPQPTFKIQFLPRTINSLKVVFDDKLQEYGVDFDVNVYVGNAIDTTQAVTGNTSIKWEYELSSQILLATGVEVVIKKWSHPGCKAKIIESFTLLQEVYDDDDIISLQIFEEADPENSNTPIGNASSNQCHLTLVNYNNRFDNDNTASPLAGNVTKRRRITPSVQLKSLDTLQLGIFYATIWNVNNEQMTAEVVGEDILSIMSEIEYTKSQFITPGSDQDFAYTTTSEFDTFTLDNLISSNDELTFKGSALLCPDGSYAPIVASDNLVVGANPPIRSYLYCGTADKTVSYTYTPGTSVTVSVSKNITIHEGTNIKYYVSWKTIDDFQEVTEDGLTFLPENISETSQNLKIKIQFLSQTTSTTMSLQDVTFTLSESVTLFSLAAKLFDDFNDLTGLIKNNYEIDQKLSETSIPNAFLPPASYRDVLKIIAEAGAANAYQRKDGFIILETLQQVQNPAKTYDNDNLFDKSFPVSPKSLYNRVTIKINELTLAATAEDIANVKVVISDGEVLPITVKFNVDPCNDTIAYSGLPASVTVTDETVYTWGADIEITNASGSDQDFTLTVTGKPYRNIGQRFVQLDESTSIRKNGIIELTIDNKLIQTEAQAQSAAEIIITSFGITKREVSIDAAIDPSIESGDGIKIDSNKYYNVSRSDLKFSKDDIYHMISGRR